MGRGAAAPQNAAPPPGALFGLPGFTQRTEQWEPWFGASTTLQQTAQKQVTEGVDLQKTDVIFWWELVLNWTNTVTAGTSAITTSPYFPFNIVQALNVPMQGQYKPIDVVSGVDAAIFQSYRPMRKQYEPMMFGASAAVATYPNSATPQANLQTGSGLASTSSPIALTFELPGSLYFDRYYDLAMDGTVLSPIPVSGHVSPQYMGGSERVVRPKITYAAGSSANLDSGPFNIGAGTGTYAGSVVSSVRRVGVLGSNNPAEMPLVRNWQYARKSQQWGLGAQGVLNVPLAGEEFGQILSLFVRLWDPSANGGLGAPININTISKCQVLYGSSLARFDDTPQTAQKRFLDQHGFLPPVGCLVWDLALDAAGNVTNAGALNTLTTSNCTIHLEFSSLPSAQAYAVVGVEALVFVAAA